MFSENSLKAKRVLLLQKGIVSLCKEHYLVPCAPLFKSLIIVTLPSLGILETALTVKKTPQLFIRNQDVDATNTRYSDNVTYMLIKH